MFYLSRLKLEKRLHCLSAVSPVRTGETMRTKKEFIVFIAFRQLVRFGLFYFFFLIFSLNYTSLHCLSAVSPVRTEIITVSVFSLILEVFIAFRQLVRFGRLFLEIRENEEFNVFIAFRQLVRFGHKVVDDFIKSFEGLHCLSAVSPVRTI